MKSLYVKDLQKGMVIADETFAVQEFEQGKTRDGKPFYKLVLSDKTGQLKGQVWSDNFPSVERGALSVGKIVMVSGTVDEFRGALQIRVEKVSKVSEAVVADYIEGSDFDLDVLWQKLETHIASINDQEIRDFITGVLADEETGRRYKTYPAAEFVHHSFRGGLLEHVVEMLDLSEPLKTYYPEANFDYVKAGIIMHDIGKIYELEPIGAAIERTKEGYLLGHLVKGYEILITKGVDLTPEKLLNLKHIVLSHHGQLDYGSPVVPATIEATIVHSIDELSSSTRIFQKIIRQNKDSGHEFTDWERLIGAKVYLGAHPDIIPEE